MTDGDVVTGWVGYALSYNNYYYGLGEGADNIAPNLGLLKVELDREGQVIRITGLFEDGRTIDRTISGTSDYFYDSGSYLYAYDYDENGEIYIDLYGESIRMPTIAMPEELTELFYGYVGNYGYQNDNNYWWGRVGKATPIETIDNLKNIQASVDYSVNAWGFETTNQVSTNIYGQTQMNVNFGDSTWSLQNLHGFSAQGSVNGNTFASNQITGTNNNNNFYGGTQNFSDHTIKAGSTINGVFIGADAQQLIGQTNITAVKDGIETTVKSVMEGYQGKGMMDR